MSSDGWDGSETSAASSEADTTRRSLLKKAAAAPFVAGAVWVAPKVQGLSLVPDVAGAQSGGTSQPFTIQAPSSANLDHAPGGSVNITAGFLGDSVALTRNTGDCVFLSINAVNQGDATATVGSQTNNGNAIGAPIGPFTGGDVGDSNEPVFIEFDMLCT